MTKIEQRIAIAEFCGWVIGPPGEALRDPQGKIVNAHYAEDWRLPDYLNDLNAMHDAETLLNEKQQVWYLQKLSQVRLKQGHGGMIACMIDRLAFATASQRAEALLRTLGRWKD